MTKPTDIVYNSIRELPLMLAAKQASWVLGISRATFYRRLDDGTIAPGVKLGPNTRRWPKAYIFSLMGDSDPGVPSPALIGPAPDRGNGGAVVG